MIPRTVQMAKEVTAQLSAAQLDSYGNVILNGYLEVVPNTTNRKAWQYKETTTAPVNLPSLTETRPAIKGWTTNYYDYYTQLQPNGYGVDPGDPTMFEYTVHSFTLFQAPIASIGGFLNNGIGYTPGTYTAVATTTSGSGTGATVDVTVDGNGEVVAIYLNSAGTGYSVGDSIVPTLPPGTGASVQVTAIDLDSLSGGGDPQWSQAPRRYNQQQVSYTTPPQYVNNPAVIQYSFMHPVADNPVPPPIGTL